jgi:hypothetical protein
MWSPELPAIGAEAYTVLSCEGIDARESDIDFTGASDSSAAFADLIGRARGRTILLPGGSTCRLEATVRNGANDVSIRGTGAAPARILVASGQSAFDFRGSTVSRSALSESARLGQSRLVVADGRLIEPGMLVFLRSDALWPFDHRNALRKGETNRVVRREGDVLHLEFPLWDDYPADRETVLATTALPRTVHLENLLVEYPPSTQAEGIMLVALVDSRIRNVELRRPSSAGINIASCIGTELVHCTARGVNDPNTGYGVQVNASLRTRVSRSTFVGCRRGVDFSGGYPSRVGVVEGSRTIGTGLDSTGAELFPNASGFGTHGTAEQIRFSGCEVSDVSVGFVSRGRTIAIQDNVGFGRMNSFVLALHGENLMIEGNRYVGSPAPGAEPRRGAPWGSLRDFLDIRDTAGRVTVRRNDASPLSRSFVRVQPMGGRVRFLTVEHNDYVLLASENDDPVHEVSVRPSTLVSISESAIVRNRGRIVTGRFVRFAPGLSLELDSMEIMGLQIRDPSTLLIRHGRGSLEDVEVDLRLDRSDQFVRACGHLAFEVRGSPVAVGIRGLPRVASAGLTYSFTSQDGTVGVLHWATTNELVVGAAEQRWAAGQRHRIAVNLTYPAAQPVEREG